jgi:hypothetical protein
MRRLIGLLISIFAFDVLVAPLAANVQPPTKADVSRSGRLNDGISLLERACRSALGRPSRRSSHDLS